MKPESQEIEPLLQREIAAHHPASSVDAILSILVDAEQGNLIRQAELFTDMEERDGHLYAEMNKRKMAISQLDWTLTAPSGAAQSEVSKIHELTELIKDSIDVSSLVFDIADGIGHGFKGIQIEWTRKNNAGLWLPAKLHPQPARWFTVDQATREQIRLRNTASSDGVELIDGGWIMHRHCSKAGEAATQGLFRALALPYLFKNFAVKNWLRFCENYGVPLRVLMHSEKDPKKKLALKKALQGMGASGVALLEGVNGEDLKTVDMTTGEGKGFESLVAWAEATMSKAILGGTLTSDTGKNGNYATARVHDEVRLQIRNHDAGQIAATLTTQLIGAIVLFNGLQIRPRWQFDTQEPEDLALYADTLPKMADAGARIPLKWVHDKLKIPMAAEGEEIMRGKAQPQPGNSDQQQLSMLSSVFSNIRPRFTPQQQKVEALADALLNNMTSPINPDAIASAIRGASDPQDLEERLAAVLGGADIAGFSEILERALFAADVMGYTHAEQ